MNVAARKATQTRLPASQLATGQEEGPGFGNAQPEGGETMQQAA